MRWSWLCRGLGCGNEVLGPAVLDRRHGVCGGLRAPGPDGLGHGRKLGPGRYMAMCLWHVCSLE